MNKLFILITVAGVVAWMAIDSLNNRPTKKAAPAASLTVSNNPTERIELNLQVKPVIGND